MQAAIIIKSINWAEATWGRRLVIVDDKDDEYGAFENKIPEDIRPEIDGYQPGGRLEIDFMVATNKEGKQMTKKNGKYLYTITKFRDYESPELPGSGVDYGMEQQRTIGQDKKECSIITQAIMKAAAVIAASEPSADAEIKLRIWERATKEGLRIYMGIMGDNE